MYPSVLTIVGLAEAKESCVRLTDVVVVVEIYPKYEALLAL